MSEASKTVTETVVNTAKKGMVKIPLEEYEELVKKAARPIIRNVTTVLKTDAQNARDNKAYGFVLMAGGAMLAGAGGGLATLGHYLYRHGKNPLK
jgi:actin-like ATPase involved in cell morphogenesis